MADHPCGRCGGPVPGAARHCPSCGEVVGADLDLVLGQAEHPAPTREVARSPRRRRGRSWAAVGGVGAIVVGLLYLGDRGGRADDAADPPAPPTTEQAESTLAPSSTTTSLRLVVPSTSPTTAPATTFTGADAVAALGQSGTLHVQREDGELSAVDLATGEVRPVLPVGSRSPAQDGVFAVLPEGVVLVGSDGRLVAVPYDGSEPVRLGRRRLAGASSTFAAVANDDGRTALVDGLGREVGAVDLGDLSRSYVRGIARGRLVVEAAGRIALIDPSSGEVEPLGTGSVVAANEWGIVQVTCPQITSCELHWGPWEEPGRQVLDASTLPSQAWGTGLSADGTGLVVQAEGGWALVDDSGTSRGSWSNLSTVVALEGGDVVATLDFDGVVTLEPVDGPAIVLVDPSTGARAVPRITSIAYVPAA